mgnify:CR=1 FL=1
MSPSIIIRVSISKQLLYVQDEETGEVLLTAPISTAKAGTGYEDGSGCTPTGTFVVCSKHGENAPLNTVFSSRIPVGVWPEAGGEDAIVSRILRLDGLEECNANTRARYIYIHGTPDIEHLGAPVSHGCIRLSPEDAAIVHSHATIGTKVFIA